MQMPVCNSFKVWAIMLLAAALAPAQTVWNGTADVSWYNTEQGSFEINTAEQLAGLAQLVNDGNCGDKLFTLGNDISLNDTTNWKDWATTPPTNSWTPIGKGRTNSFNGTFDGAGFVIGGVFINSSDDEQGLFGSTDMFSLILNLGVTASYIKGADNVGGLVGWNFGTIYKSYAAGNVTGNNGVGGLVGHDNGTMYSITIDNCYAAGNVTGNENVGGLVGLNYGGVTNSYAAGNVTGNDNVGGLVGQNNAIYNHVCMIVNSYAVGNITGNENVGGLVGLDYDGSITSSYYNSETPGAGTYGTPKTTSELRQQATYTDWDFNTIWAIDAAINGGYPHLREFHPTSVFNDKFVRDGGARVAHVSVRGRTMFVNA